MMTDILGYFHDGEVAADDTGDVIDTATENGLGAVDNTKLYIRVKSAFSSETNDVTFTLEDSPDNGTWTEVYSFTVDQDTSMTEAGEIFAGHVPSGTQRYLRVNIGFASNPSSAGDIAAFIAM